MARFDPVLLESKSPKADDNPTHRHLQDEAGRLRSLEIRQKGMAQSDKAREIHLHLVVEGADVEFGGVCQVIRALDSSVEKDAVDIGRLLHNPG
jgi:hypothetical protein